MDTRTPEEIVKEHYPELEVTYREDGVWSIKLDENYTFTSDNLPALWYDIMIFIGPPPC